MLDETLKKVVEKWKSEDLEIILPYSEKEVRESFNKIGKPVSRDVIQVYTIIGGMTFMDSNLLLFWPLEQLVDENSSPRPPDNLTFFGDFLIFSHFYGFKYENESLSSV